MNPQPRSRLRRMIAGLGVTLLLMLILLLVIGQFQQPAYSQGLQSSSEEPIPLSVEATSTRVPCPDGSTPTPAPAGTPISTVVPTPAPPGQKVELYGDEEVFLSFRQANDQKALANTIFDNPTGTTQLIVTSPEKWWTTLPRVANISWLTNTTGDLNGDGSPEHISAFKNSNGQLGALSWSLAVATPTDWYGTAARYVAGSVGWIDVAAGDLDRGHDNDEVVIAFRDYYEDIHVVAINGSATIGGDLGSQMAEWWKDDLERGSINHATVDTGDLDGDGVDDEIVVAYKDSGNDLQVQFLQYDGTGTLQELWRIDSRDNGRDNVANSGAGDFANKWPIDVTTGDIDGDMRDEVVLAFRIGDATNGNVQLWALDVNPGLLPAIPWTVESSVWRDHPISKPSNTVKKAATMVSVSAADLDGDGADEIALAYNIAYEDLCNNSGYSYVCNGRWLQQLVTYEYTPFAAPEYELCAAGSPQKGCFRQRSGSWSGPANYLKDSTSEGRVVVSAGDLDRDTKDEVALVHYKIDNDNLELLTFDADATLALRSAVERDLGSNWPSEFWIAMDDRTDDTRYARYTGTCYRKKEAQVASVIFAPPHWPEGHIAGNYDATGASFDSKSLQSSGESLEVSTSVGASVTVNPSVHDIGASFTYGWEKEASAEKTQTKSIENGLKYSTCPEFFCNSVEFPPNYNGVQIVETSFNCFVYNEGSIGNMDVCLPYYTRTLPYPHDLWYTEGYATYPDSWVPLSHNLAEGRLAAQSSEDPAYPAPASRSVDGDVTGAFLQGHVSHTGYGTPPYTSYWQVDLGGDKWIGAIQIFNRTDTDFTKRLSNFYVFVSKAPFTRPDAIGYRKDPNVWKTFVAGEAGRPTIIPVNHEGRYIRVQLYGPDPSIDPTAAGFLDMAELQVFGMPVGPDQWPNTRPTAADGSFTITWPDPNKGAVTQNVAGQLLGVDSDKTSMAPGTLGQESSIGFGVEGETIESSATSHETTLGMEIIWVSGEVSSTSSQKKSYILAWEENIGFYGEAVGLPRETTPATIAPYSYEFSQYVWLQRATSRDGVSHAFLVGGYWVPQIGIPGAVQGPPLKDGPAATPQLPVVKSPSHPDPDVWVADSTAVFKWRQPNNDATAIAGYRWLLDQSPDTIPYESNRGLTAAETYEDLSDGVWYLHVRAVSTGGQWSETAHRAIRVDANAPTVELALDPAVPTGDNDWYITPIAVAVSAADGDGSGVTGIEYSTDGAIWQPYSAAVAFTSDTAGTTFQARAVDAVGNVSEPVAMTFKIDRTAPDSHVSGGQGPGAYVADVFTGDNGNEVLALAGAIEEELSGISGFSLEYDGLDWTGADPIGSWYPFPEHPEIEVNWYFTATHQIGAGNHIFMGRAQDAAGNQEEPYEIARVLWVPTASPDIDGSSVSVSPTTARPGDEVTFTLVARNAGWQEAHVAIVNTLPEGLTPVDGSLPADVTYDPAARTITWPAQLLWPGQWARVEFKAQVAAGTTATTLENRATFHAFWPNTDLLPDEQQQPFIDHEQTTTKTACLVIDPALPADSDRTPPWAFIAINRQAAITGPVVEVGIPAAEDAQWMYLREWQPDPMTGSWVIVQDSGWTAYRRTLEWTLSDGQGVKYLGVWVKDRAGNISILDENSLAYINRMDEVQTLEDGERVQYRGFLEEGSEIWGALETIAGDPDVFVWRPRNAFWPDRFSNATVEPGQVEQSAYRHIQQSGRYLIEIQAFGPSEFEFVIGGAGPESNDRDRTEEKPIPAHPLTVSDPLSAGQTGSVADLEYKLYLPVTSR